MLEVEPDIALESGPKLLTSVDSIKAWTIFPKQAIQQHIIYGFVYVRIRVDTTGKPECEAIELGLPYGCNEAALNVAKKTRFTPAIQHRRKIAVDIVLPIEFKLKL